MGAKHLTPGTGSGWRRRLLGLPLVGWLVLAVAGVALAGFIVLQTTATSTFSATSVGSLNIHDAATTPLFDPGGR
jgi:hypothetical protein